MEKSATLSATYFAIYSIFLFYQTSLLKNFNGSSQGFLMLITFSSFAGYLGQIIYFIYYGWHVSWIQAIGIMLASIFLGSIVGALIERILGGLAIAFFGFLAMPYFGYMMFQSIPSSSL